MDDGFCAMGFDGLFYHASNLDKYSNEEFDAACGTIKMTEEIFEKNIKTAISIFDFEYLKYLVRKFPDFAGNCPILNEIKFIKSK